MLVMTVAGARPQFIKCAPMSAALRARHEEILVHTGQHYDAALSRVFFDEMDLPAPDHNLDVGSGSHAAQTAGVMTRLEPLVMRVKPDALLVYGDTNSTLGAALTAAKLHVPVVHVEAGLRSFNRDMPEEVNRVVVDHVSRVLCCPCAGAARNLEREGIVEGVVETGDVMYDAFLRFRPLSAKRPIVSQLGLREGDYTLLTVHRAENTEHGDNLRRILRGVNDARARLPRAEFGGACLFPVHPRTRAAMEKNALAEKDYPNIRFVEPLGYLDFLAVSAAARIIVTDSGGLQKEAYWHGVPCVTIRTETEWVETVEAGWNCLAGTDSEKIADAIATFRPSTRAQGFRAPGPRPTLYGEGDAAEKVVKAMETRLG